MAFGRRDFLKAVELAAAGAALPAISCARPEARPAARRRNAPEAAIVSVCGSCPGGCGIRARIVGGRLAGISGNPLHPVNRGGLCPLGIAGAQLVHHPDRVRGPLRREGGEGPEGLRPVSWDIAVGDLAGRLRELRGRGLAHTVALVDGTRGLAHDLAGRFLAAFGSPNLLAGRAWNDTAATEAMQALQGVGTPAAYDIENARFVLAFGSGWLEGSWSPVAAARAYGIARRGRKSGRVRVVHVEPRLSVSAAHADEWLPVAPGSEGALALGLMHMVLREGLEDQAFLDRWSTGFDWLRALVLRDYHPDAVSELTGVPVATIIRLARQFASTRPAVAIGDDRPGAGAQTPQVRMAIHALNALVGAINSPGGVLAPPPVPLDPLPAAPTDEQARRGLAAPAIPGGDVRGLSTWLDGLATYPVNVLLAFGSDPVSLLGGAERARSLLRRVPYVVSFSSFLDETAARADLVLPDHTWLERWEDDPCFTSRGFPVLGLRQPVLAPRHATRHAPEVLADVARALGGPAAAALPWKSFREVIVHGLRGIHRSGRGALFDIPEAEAWVGTMEKGGWRASDFGTFDRFWQAMVARGGWWDPIYDFGERGRALRTPSGRFDFSPLAREIERRSADPARPLLGAAAPPAGFPLRLHLFPLLAAFGHTQGPTPWVQDVLGHEMGQSWALWVELSPGDAAALGVRDGDRVRVESPAGSLLARAHVYPGLRPGVAALPLGPGGAPGRVQRRALDAHAAALVGASGDTWVRLRRV